VLKAVFSAIVGALKAAGRILGRVVATPFRMLDGLLGGGGPPVPPEIPEVLPPEPVEPTFDRAAMYADIANAVMAWCADSVISDRPVALPPHLPIALREWMPGLNRAECSTLMNADKIAVSDHLERTVALPGVRSVQPLRPLREWPAALALVVAPETASFAAIALDCSPSPS
jgi:hypothetical protein